jgi:hypothetical protein
VTFAPVTKLKKKINSRDKVLENNLGPPASWRERGWRRQVCAAQRRAPRSSHRGEPGSPRGPWAAARCAPPRATERSAQATRVCPLASVGIRSSQRQGGACQESNCILTL